MRVPLIAIPFRTCDVDSGSEFSLLHFGLDDLASRRDRAQLQRPQCTKPETQNDVMTAEPT